MNEVKPYMQLDKLREGMFWAAGQLYGFEFKKIDGVPVYHPDMTVYEVTKRRQACRPVVLRPLCPEPASARAPG
jgi:peptidyl-dipeptidase Dcp